MAFPSRSSRGPAGRYEQPWDLARREFSDALSRFFGPGVLGGWIDDGGLAPFGVDIREDADRIYIEADLPGFRKEDVDISLDNGVLTVTAEKRQDAGDAGAPDAEGQSGRFSQGDYVLRERRYERFQRSFTLPTSVDEENVDARLENGCLCVTLNKSPESKRRKIPVT
jgi:HSP20 family protein